MKKKGFTLVELLATIVIIGIISLITTAVVLSVIDNANKESFKASAMGIIDAVDYYLWENDLDELPKEGVSIEELDFKNKEQFISGKVKYNSDGQLMVSMLSNGTWCASGTKDNLQIESNCGLLDDTAPEIVDTGIIVSRTTNSITIKIAENGVIENESTIKSYKYEIKKDDIEKSSGEITETSYTFKSLESGTYKVIVTVTNKSNLTSKIEKSVTLLNCPTPTIVVTPTGWANKKTATIDYGENNTCSGSYSYSTDGGKTFSDWQSGTSLEITINGTMIKARNTDSINTVSSSNYTVSQIDKNKPTVTLSLGTVTTSKATVTANCSDTESGVASYKFYNGSTLEKTYTTSNTSQSHTYKNLGKESTNNLKVVCTDAAGLSDEASTSSTTKTLTPTYAIDKTGWQAKKTVTITYPTISGETLTNYYRVGTGDWIKVTETSKDVEFTSNGTVTAKMIDEAGHEFAASAYTVSQVDSTTTKPTCSIVVSSGTLGSNSWYTSNVGIKMTTSSASASGITYGFGTNNEAFYTTGSATSGNVGAATSTIAGNGTTTYYGYVKSGTGLTGKCSLTIKKDSTTPSTPTIASSDSKVSGSWHTSPYSLSLSGSSSISGVTYYYGTTTSPSKKGTNITSGAGLSSAGSQTYYANACNGAGTCSSNASYIARLDTCDPEINLSFAGADGQPSVDIIDTSSGLCYYSGIPIVATATTSCSGGKFTWYVDGEVWESTENSTSTESTLNDYMYQEDDHTISVKLESAGGSGTKYYTKTDTLEFDGTEPVVNLSVSTTPDTATVVIYAEDTGCAELDEDSYMIRYKAENESSWTTITNSTSSKKITGLQPATKYSFEAYACDYLENCTWSHTNTVSTTYVKLPTVTLEKDDTCGNTGYVYIDGTELDESLSYTIYLEGNGHWYDDTCDGFMTSGTGSYLSDYSWHDINFEFPNPCYPDGAYYPDESFLGGGEPGDSFTFCAANTTYNYEVCETYTLGDSDNTSPTTTAPTLTATTNTIWVKNRQTDTNGLTQSSIQYKKSTDSLWKSISSASIPYTISSLEADTTYDVRTYSYDDCGNYSYSSTAQITTKGNVYDCKYSNLTYAGYKVTCNVSSSVAKVKLPTWTTNNGQDDLYWYETTPSNGIVSYTINSSKHNYEAGTYSTHVYAYNSSGTQIGFSNLSVTVPNSGPYKAYSIYDKFYNYTTYVGGLVWEASNTINPYVKIATKGDSLITSSSLGSGKYMSISDFLKMLSENDSYEEWIYRQDPTASLQTCFMDNYQFVIESGQCEQYLSPITGEDCTNGSGSDYYYLDDTAGTGIAFDYECEATTCTVTLSCPPSSSYPVVIKKVSK